MQALAAYVLRGRIQAAGVIGLLGAVGWMFPLSFLLSSAAVALVVLKKGAREGLLVLIGATVFCTFIAFFRFGTPILAIMNALAVWLPVWIVAQVLRTTRSQTSTLIVVMIMSLLLAIGIRFFVGDIEVFWHDSLTKYADKIAIVDKATLSTTGSAEVIKKLSVIMNGFVAVSFGLMTMLSVLLGRWWQSSLFNPSGFGEEFRKIQMPVLITAPILVAAILVGVVKLPVPPYGILLDLLMIGLAILMFHGLAIVHFFIKEMQLGNGWLAGLYFFLIAASVYVISVLAMLAISDSYSDYRKLKNIES